jgi:aminoglycoside phosphotransferase (APT) family kinase protein
VTGAGPAPAPVVDTDTLRRWVAKVSNGEVTGWRQLVSGNSRQSFVAAVRVGGRDLELVVRHDGGGGPVAGTELSLEREAVVYRALAGSGVPVPRLYGVSSSLQAMAISLMPGSPADPERALGDLLGRLSDLHELDVQALVLPGLERTALGDLELWARIAHQKFAEPDELVDFAFEQLRDLFPGEPEQIVLCHGDAGMGNFLALDGRVTALLDWEFCHLGDPHDDLAWITVRALMFGAEIDGFGALVRDHYRAFPVSARRLAYWQAVVVLRNLVCCIAVATGPERSRDRFVHLMLLPGLRHRLVRMLAGLRGVALDPPEPLPELSRPPGDLVLAELAAGLVELIDEIPGAEARQRARRMRRLLSGFAQTWSVAAEVGRANEADRAAAGDDPDPASRLRYLSRATERELALAPRLSPIAGGRLAGLQER